MKKTAAWLVRYALEQLKIEFTFGIPGVQNTEIYDQLDQSESIEPILVTHEGYGAFMADAVSRCGKSMGTCLIVPAAGVTHAASGIGEAMLDGIPMLVISGGVRNDGKFSYQLHEIDQHKFAAALTKKTFKVNTHEEVIPTLYKAFDIANDGEPGPVFVEIPVNLQLDKGAVSELPVYKKPPNKIYEDIDDKIIQAVKLLSQAKNPGLFIGWGAVDANADIEKIAELLSAPVSTTLQGLSSFSAKHPLHTGMGFGIAAVPAATNAFKNCDCLLAIGTRFAEIGTASYGIDVPENLIHIDINSKVFNANYPAKVTIQGDAKVITSKLLEQLNTTKIISKDVEKIKSSIKKDKQKYLQEWLNHKSKERVNPAAFFQQLRKSIDDDAYVIADDGNHTFLTAELMPIYKPRHFFSPTDFNCMGYAIPAVIGTKLSNPKNQVVSIIGDGAFLMSQMELFTAAKLNLAVIFIIFNDGDLAQISQTQTVPFNKKTCSELPDLKFKALVETSGCHYIRMQNNQEIKEKISQAIKLLSENTPIVLDVNIDYSKTTRFTKGIIKTNLNRMKLPTKLRMIGRALWRRV